MPEREFISQFTPQRTDPEALERILVQRHDLLRKSVEKLRESVLSENKHHLLFIGPRGAGKSHLVTLIHHRLHEQEDLRPLMRFAWLNEDETSTSFLALLIRIYRSLSDRYEDEFPADTLQAIRGKDAASAREVLGAALLHHLGEHTVVLIMENLDSLFSHMSEGEQHNWRGFIQNHPVFAIAATAQSLFDGVSKREKPFFGFFDTTHLKNLSVEEATDLLEKIADLNGQPELVDFLRTSTGRARLRAVHHLSGGNPRLYIILSDFLTKDALDNLVRPFEEVVDRQLTSYYQERMRWLTPQQREIVQLLCREGHPIPVKDIAAGIFAPHGSVTSQLKQLREMGYLSTHPRGREVLYELAEPLMRLSFQVKETNDRKPLELIVDFLRVWYDRADIEKRLERIAPGAEGRDYLEAALEKLMIEGPKLRHELMRRDVEGVDPKACDDRQLELLKSLAEETDYAADWLSYEDACYHRGDLAAAISCDSLVIGMSGTSPKEVARALNNRGVCYDMEGRTAEAIADYSRAIDLPGAPPEQVAKALNNRGLCHDNEGRTDEAIADYSRIIDLPGAPPEQMAKALNNRGACHDNEGRRDEAIADYSRAIDLPGAPPEQLAIALNNRGVCHYKEGRTDEAIADCSRAIDLPGSPPGQVALALNNRGVCYNKEGRTTEAIANYSRAVDLPGAPPERAALAVYNRGVCYDKEGRTDEAIADYSRIIDLPGSPPEHVARSLNNRGVCYDKEGRTAEAIADYSRAIDLPGAPPEHVAIAFFSRSDSNRIIGATVDSLQDLKTGLELADKHKEAADFFTKHSRFYLRHIVKLAAALANSPPQWPSGFDSIITSIEKLGLLKKLGDALVEHLSTLNVPSLPLGNFDAWVTAWEQLTGTYSEMTIPLRMLRTGVEYIKTKDEGSLLTLVKEERSIVRQALGLPEEEE